MHAWVAFSCFEEFGNGNGKKERKKGRLRGCDSVSMACIASERVRSGFTLLHCALARRKAGDRERDLLYHREVCVRLDEMRKRK